jgi:hypothetical protein
VAPDEEVDRWWARAEAGRESRARVPEWITPRRGEKREKRKQARGGEAEEKRYRHPLRSAVHGDVT